MVFCVNVLEPRCMTVAMTGSGCSLATLHKNASFQMIEHGTVDQLLSGKYLVSSVRSRNESMTLLECNSRPCTLAHFVHKQVLSKYAKL